MSCSKCERLLPYNLFYRDKKGKHGYSYLCKDCIRARERTPEWITKRKEYLKRHRTGETYKKILKYKQEWRRELKERAYESMGGKCSRCGFDDPRALQVDHVSGGGSQDKTQHNRELYYRNIIKNNNGKYQLLCANCNWIKRWEKKESKPWGNSL